jgi:hypothetical protein
LQIEKLERVYADQRRRIEKLQTAAAKHIEQLEVQRELRPEFSPPDKLKNNWEHQRTVNAAIEQVQVCGVHVIT